MDLLRQDEQLDDLQLNGLKIIQKKSGFCFGVDAVLLANFVKSKKDATVVDLGTGTGIISVLINAKSNVKKIYAVEIQERIADMAKRTMHLNNMSDKIEVMNINLKDTCKYLQKQSVDIVVSNPPYMQKEKLTSPNEMQRISRNEIFCDIDDVMSTASELLKFGAKMYMVHRPTRLCDILVAARKHDLEPKQMRMVYPRLGKPANLVLLSFTKNAKSELKMLEPLFIHEQDGSYTKEVRDIYDKKTLEFESDMDINGETITACKMKTI